MFKVGDAVSFEVDCEKRKGTIKRVDDVDDGLPYLVSYMFKDGFPVCLWVKEHDVTALLEEGVNDCSSSVFVVGDVVTLRSGGPWMTVAQLNGSEIGCTWFSGDGEILRHEYFPDECLKKVVDEP